MFTGFDDAPPHTASLSRASDPCIVDFGPPEIAIPIRYPAKLPQKKKRVDSMVQIRRREGEARHALDVKAHNTARYFRREGQLPKAMTEDRSTATLRSKALSGARDKYSRSEQKDSHRARDEAKCSGMESGKRVGLHCKQGVSCSKIPGVRSAVEPATMTNPLPGVAPLNPSKPGNEGLQLLRSLLLQVQAIGELNMVTKLDMVPNVEDPYLPYRKSTHPFCVLHVDAPVRSSKTHARVPLTHIRVFPVLSVATKERNTLRHTFPQVPNTDTSDIIVCIATPHPDQMTCHPWEPSYIEGCKVRFVNGGLLDGERYDTLDCIDDHLVEFGFHLFPRYQQMLDCCLSRGDLEEREQLDRVYGNSKPDLMHLGLWAPSATVDSTCPQTAEPFFEERQYTLAPSSPMKRKGRPSGWRGVADRLHECLDVSIKYRWSSTLARE